MPTYSFISHMHWFAFKSYQRNKVVYLWITVHELMLLFTYYISYFMSYGHKTPNKKQRQWRVGSFGSQSIIAEGS